MKKKLAVLAGAILLSGMIAACGGEEDVKVVNKLPESKEAGEKAEAESTENEEEVLSGYIFQVEKDGETVSVAADMDMSTAEAALGEPVSYFEAESCAFHGLDKTYTYEHFQIETYPDGDTDRISTILFLDDIVQTAEGISLGMTQEDIEKAYGTDYEDKDGKLVFTKDENHLAFILQDGVIQSIEYNSKALDKITLEAE